MLVENNRFNSKSPELIEIDTSNICNLKCKTCMRSNPDYLQLEPRFLSLQNFKTIIDKIPELNTVQFCGASEPTLNRELPQMIDYAKQRGAKHVETFTNGTLLCGKVAEKLAESNLDMLKVSIDGADEESYRIARGFDLLKVIENVRNFRKMTLIPIGIEYVLSKYTQESVKKLPGLVRAVGANLLEVRLINWVDPNLEKDALYDPLKLAEIKSYLQEEADKQGFQLRMFLPTDGGCTECTTPTELYVDFDGNVTPCYFLNRTIIGNLISSPYEKVWNGNELNRYRQNYANGKALPDCCCSRGLIINNRVNSK